MSTHAVAITCSVFAAAGVILAFALKDWRPIGIALCLAWLGGEYIDHRKKADR